MKLAIYSTPLNQQHSVKDPSTRWFTIHSKTCLTRDFTFKVYFLWDYYISTLQANSYSSHSRQHHVCSDSINYHSKLWHSSLHFQLNITFHDKFIVMARYNHKGHDTIRYPTKYRDPIQSTLSPLQVPGYWPTGEATVGQFLWSPGSFSRATVSTGRQT